MPRCENITAMFDAYPGSKVFMNTNEPGFCEAYMSDRYPVVVMDDFPKWKRKNVIMIWHGIQGGKKIGLDQPMRPYYRLSLADNMTFIISASEKMIPVWSKCTGVPSERILPLGFPRTDQYFNNRPKKSNDKITYLYVPTFRDRFDPKSPEIDWRYIDDELTDNEELIVKLHPWIASHDAEAETPFRIEYFKHIKLIEAYMPTTPYLYDADIVITDYSSIMFDALLLDKPIILFDKRKDNYFASDYTQYACERGMYLPYPYGYTDYFVKSESELIETIHMRMANYGITAEERMCRSITAGACDGHSCERITALINTLKDSYYSSTTSPL